MTDAATIFVRFTSPGLHCWDGAPPHRSYLGQPHRHLFHVEARMLVTHDDREVEFHDLQDYSHFIFGTLGLDGNYASQSCEMLARALGIELAAKFQRPVTVIVSEDGECGAQVDVAAP
jgi:hypothetical protein